MNQGGCAMDSLQRKQKADKILYEMSLLKHLEGIGKPHIIGSYRMDMMAWNDLDIDVENHSMNASKLYQLTTYILDTFHPCWYEAKEETNNEGKTVWFHGFHTIIDGEMWNLDIWFFDQETISKAEDYCDSIAKMVGQNPDSKEKIIRMKQELIRRNLYGFYQYSSMDVYHAVLKQNISDIEDLLKHSTHLSQANPH